jgi:replicative DNA helicase
MADNELNEAERAILGGCIQDRDIFYKTIGLITPEDFEIPAHQKIFADLSELRGKEGVGDSASLIEFMKGKKDLASVGGDAYIRDLLTYLPLSDELDYYINIVRDKSLARKFFKTVNEIQNDYNSKAVPDISDFIGQAEQKLIDITGSRRVSEFRTTKEVLTSLKQQFKEDTKMRQELGITESYITGYPTGYDDVDKLSGGFHPSDLIILAARPSVGKTALALNFAQKMAKNGKTVGIFSLEMSAEKILLRLLSEESGLKTNSIATMNFDDLSPDFGSKDNAHFALSNAIKNLESEKIMIDDTSALKLSDIISKSRKLKAKFSDLSLIVIDYLGLITNPTKNNSANRTQEVSDITRGLKAMAKDLKVPVMVLCQLSRGVEARTGHKPALSDLRDSGSIEQGADMVFFIYRPDYYSEEDEQKKERGGFSKPDSGSSFPSAPRQNNSSVSPTTLMLSKNRNGPTGEVNFIFYRDTCRFEAVASPDKVGEDPR